MSLVLFTKIKDKIDATIAEIDKMGESLTTFLESSSYEGETANSIKSYFNEIHGSMLSSIKTTAQRVQDDMAMNDYWDDTDGYMEEISKALATTSSIFNYTYPSGSANDIIEEPSIISQKITKLEND